MSGVVSERDTFRRGTDVDWVVIDGEAVLYHHATESLHHLNASATAVWIACDGQTSIGAILATVERGHGAAVVGEDVLDLVTRLRNARLLERARPEDDPG